MDIVEELRESSSRILDGSAIMCEARSELLMFAAAEIERLRLLAGAVTPGPSFDDIKKMISDHDRALTYVGSAVARIRREDLRPGTPDGSNPILKNFDGA